MTTDDPNIFWRPTKRRWVLSYKARDGRWAQKYVPGKFAKGMKREARDWAREWLEQADTRQLEPQRRGDGLSLRVAHERWLGIVDREGTAPATRANYRSDFRRHVFRDEGLREDERISHLTVAEIGTDFARLKLWYLAIVRRCTSASRARSVFSTFRVFFDEAIVQRWFRGANPFRNKTLVKLLPAMPTKRERPPKVLPLEHAQALILGRVGRRGSGAQLELGVEEAPAEEVVPGPRRVRYALAFTSGDRDGELSGLRWGSLRLDDPIPIMEVERSRRLVRSRDEELGPTKTTSSARTMPLHPAAVAALRWWRDDEDGVRWLLERPPQPLDPVFPSERHGGTAAFSRPRSAVKIRQDLEALGLPAQTPRGQAIDMHSTRRTFLTLLEREGVEERHRKVLAGHGIADVTHRHYTADDEARLRELAAAVAKIPLVWERPLPLSRHRFADFLPEPLPGVVPPAKTRGEGVHLTPGDDTGMTGAPGTNRTCDLRFRNSNEAAALACQSDSSAAADSESDGDAIGAFAADGFAREGISGAGKNARPGPARARVPRGAEGVRLEVDGVEIARTDARPGELVEDVEARLKLAAGQRGGLPR